MDDNTSDRAAGIVLLPTEDEFGRPHTPGMVTWWAARALGDPDLCDEDREMAEAAYSRAMDVQMGTVGKGTKGGIREIFPIGDVVRAERAAKADAERAAADEASRLEQARGLLW